MSSDAAPTHRHHALDYLELFAADLTAAKDFYTRAFGWEFTDYGPDYAGFRTPGGEEFGGLTPHAPRPDAASRATPWVFLHSRDLDATLGSVEAAIAEFGGQITVAAFEFPGGRRFMFADPDGNVLGVWSPA